MGQQLEAKSKSGGNYTSNYLEFGLFRLTGRLIGEAIFGDTVTLGNGTFRHGI
jgi:hypothetical protein